ncbi:hypothetical protein Tco_0911129 [Tanacetum coccineum]|uniref:Uncharacterized protein n=1 Tax=Tanacetum coccineum TaxID=301880 RepID=A0ABQ5D136_9ASTR
MSLTLWNDEVQAVVDRSAYQLCEKYAKYAFKVSIDEYNVKKLLQVFTVLCLPDDPEILASILLSVTPSKMDTEATSSALPKITSLDLESQTDEKTTHVSTQKNNVVDHVKQQHASDGKNKRAAENDIGNESSIAKKRLLKTAVVAGLHDNEETNNKKQKNGCSQEEVEKRVPVTSDMKPDVNDEKPDEYYYEIEAEEQKSIRMAKEEYEEDHVVKEEYDQEDDEDNEIENCDYDDLHLAYLGDKSPKL